MVSQLITLHVQTLVGFTQHMRSDSLAGKHVKFASSSSSSFCTGPPKDVSLVHHVKVVNVYGAACINVYTSDDACHHFPITLEMPANKLGTAEALTCHFKTKIGICDTRESNPAQQLGRLLC